MDHNKSFLENFHIINNQIFGTVSANLWKAEDNRTVKIEFCGLLQIATKARNTSLFYLPFIQTLS